MGFDLAQVPPRPERVTTRTVDGRPDEYAWLRERSDPRVIAHLQAENAHTDAVTAPARALAERLYGEIVGRVQETDTSAPVRFRGHVYRRRTVKGSQYPIHERRPDGADGPHQVVLDENREAEGLPFYRLGIFQVSPDQRLLAHGFDPAGGERHSLRFRDLESGRDLSDAVEGAHYGGAWSADGTVFFYTRANEAWRAHQVWRHRLGTRPAEDVLVFTEPDERFNVDVRLTRSERFVLISSESETTSEWLWVPAAEPERAPRVILPREPGVEYTADHQEDHWLVLTNREAPEFRLLRSPLEGGGWAELVPERAGVRLHDLDVYRDHVVLAERFEGTSQIEVLDSRTSALTRLAQPDEVFATHVVGLPDYAGGMTRFVYSSLNTPPITYDLDLATGARTEVKREPVLGGFEAGAYETHRLWAPAPDGVPIPISVVHRRDVAADGRNPALLHGYGAYEIPLEAGFRSSVVSLLDRGFVFAIAHVRGGGEMGRRWWEAGRLLHKRNTFTDFSACADHLVAEGWAARERLAIRGGSAGGLLVGATLNLRPDLCACAVAEVPFVDVLSTMLDPTLPLTVAEYDEWGDPRDPEFHRYIASYSPYDNVRDAPYPAVLATAGINDTRVSYWEPAKWVARLRDRGRPRGPVLLRVRMGAGHAGPSGRYDAWREEAFVQAFLISALGAPEAPILS